MQMMKKSHGGNGKKQGGSSKKGGEELDYEALARARFKSDKGCAYMSIAWLTGISSGEIVKSLFSLAGGKIEDIDEDRVIIAYVNSNSSFTKVSNGGEKLEEFVSSAGAGSYLAFVGVGSTGHALAFVSDGQRISSGYDTTAIVGKSKGDMMKDWGWQKVMGAWKFKK